MFNLSSLVIWLRHPLADLVPGNFRNVTLEVR